MGWETGKRDGPLWEQKVWKHISNIWKEYMHKNIMLKRDAVTFTSTLEVKPFPIVQKDLLTF